MVWFNDRFALSDLEEYDELLTDDGKNIASLFPTDKL